MRFDTFLAVIITVLVVLVVVLSYRLSTMTLV